MQLYTERNIFCLRYVQCCTSVWEGGEGASSDAERWRPFRPPPAGGLFLPLFLFLRRIFVCSNFPFSTSFPFPPFFYPFAPSLFFLLSSSPPLGQFSMPFSFPLSPSALLTPPLTGAGKTYKKKYCPYVFSVATDQARIE